MASENLFGTQGKRNIDSFIQESNHTSVSQSSVLAVRISWHHLEIGYLKYRFQSMVRPLQRTFLQGQVTR